MLALRLVRVAAFFCALPLATLRAQLSSDARLDRRDELLAADRAAADSTVRHGLTATLSALSEPDLVLVYPGAPVIVGREAAGQLLAAQPVLARLTVRWVPLYAEVSSDGDYGVSYGVTAMASDAPPPGGPLRLGKYLSAWRRTGAGWRIVAHAEVGFLPASVYATPAGFTAPPLPALPKSGAVADFARADVAFAAQAGKEGAPAAFAAYAAEDAVAFPGTGELARGPEAIRRWLSPGPQAAWAWRPVAGGAAASGDLGFTVGTSEITAPGESPFYGKYLTLWRREAGNRIRFISDGGNARPAP